MLASELAAFLRCHPRQDLFVTPALAPLAEVLLLAVAEARYQRYLARGGFQGVAGVAARAVCLRTMLCWRDDLEALARQG